MVIDDPLFAANASFDPYWWEALRRDRDPPPPLPARTDVAVIGGGFTGMSAALTLAEGGRQVTVLEAGHPGEGASTRNGGMFGPGTNMLSTALGEYGPDMAQRMVADMQLAHDHVWALIQVHAIACHAAATGHFRGAMTPRVYDRMGREVERIRRHVRYEVQMVSRAEQHREVGTELYHGGILNPLHCGLHPGLFHQGLLDAATRAGARVHGQTPVRGLRRDGDGFTIDTPRGRLQAGAVLVATNAYTGALHRFLRRRVIPIRSAMIATEELPEETMARLMPQRRMLAGSQRIVTYYRPSPDGRRILFGGRVLKLGDGAVQRANAGHLHAMMVQVFPELASVKVAHYWHGQTGFTFDHLPHTGVVDGVHYAMGYCGVGVSRAPWLGHKAARRILGAQDSATPFAELNFRTRPLYFGRPWFLPVALALYNLHDRWDQR